MPFDGSVYNADTPPAPPAGVDLRSHLQDGVARLARALSDASGAPVHVLSPGTITGTSRRTPTGVSFVETTGEWRWIEATDVARYIVRHIEHASSYQAVPAFGTAPPDTAFEAEARARREAAIEAWSKVPPARWEMGIWGDGECACALGWLANGGVDGWRWETSRHSSVRLPVWGGEEHPIHAAARYFGLSVCLARHLFGGWGHTAAQVAEVLRAASVVVPTGLPVSPALPEADARAA